MRSARSEYETSFPGTPFVTLAQVKEEIGIPVSDTASDNLLQVKLEAALSTVGTHIGVALLDVSVTDYYKLSNCLILSRKNASTPVVAEHNGSDFVTITQKGNYIVDTTTNPARVVFTQPRERLTQYIQNPLRVTYNVSSLLPADGEDSTALVRIVLDLVRVYNQTDSDGNYLPGGVKAVMSELEDFTPILWS